MYNQTRSRMVDQYGEPRCGALILIPIMDLGRGGTTLDVIASLQADVLSPRAQQWDMSAATQATDMEKQASRLARWRAIRLALFFASALLGTVVVLSALGVWSGLNAASLGLDDRRAFCLLAGGAYLLIAVLYSAWRTRLLHDLESVSWDVRLMAYGSLGVGGLASVTLGILVLATLAVIVLLLSGIVALLRSSQEWPT